MSISYAVQPQPKGIAQSFIIGEKFIGKDSICLILGDNIFYGHNLTEILNEAAALKNGALIFGYYVKNPESYGVIEFNSNFNAISIEEKPKKPKSNWAVTGLYFFDNNVIGISKKLKPSKRGELEISDVNNEYLRQRKLKVKLLGRGYAWLDAGNCESLIDASIFIKTVEERQGLKIGCIEEVAYKMGFIGEKDLRKLTKGLTSSYGKYLSQLLEDEK